MVLTIIIGRSHFSGLLMIWSEHVYIIFAIRSGYVYMNCSQCGLIGCCATWWKRWIRHQRAKSVVCENWRCQLIFLQVLVVLVVMIILFVKEKKAVMIILIFCFFFWNSFDFQLYYVMWNMNVLYMAYAFSFFVLFLKSEYFRTKYGSILVFFSPLWIGSFVNLSWVCMNHGLLAW